MTPGATVNWKDHLKQNIGSDMSAKPMVEYFNPLYNWLKEENKNRTYSLPEKL
jgi:peptidyl-dipeptidase A